MCVGAEFRLGRDSDRVLLLVVSLLCKAENDVLVMKLSWRRGDFRRRSRCVVSCFGVCKRGGVS